MNCPTRILISPDTDMAGNQAGDEEVSIERDWPDPDNQKLLAGKSTSSKLKLTSRRLCVSKGSAANCAVSKTDKDLSGLNDG